jgi:hypothetical protein
MGCTNSTPTTREGKEKLIRKYLQDIVAISDTTSSPQVEEKCKKSLQQIISLSKGCHFEHLFPMTQNVMDSFQNRFPDVKHKMKNITQKTYKVLDPTHLYHHEEDILKDTKNSFKKFRNYSQDLLAEKEPTHTHNSTGTDNSLSHGSANGSMDSLSMTTHNVPRRILRKIVSVSGIMHTDRVESLHGSQDGDYGFYDMSEHY